MYKVTLAVVKGVTKQQHETLAAEVLMPMFATDIPCAEHVPYLLGAAHPELVILSLVE